MNAAEVIGNNIKKLMKKNGISQRKLAEVIGVTHPTLGKYVSGEQIIDSEKLSILSRFFNLSFDYFFIEEHKKLNLLFRADKPSENIEEFEFQKIYQKFQNYIDIVDLGRIKYIPQVYNLQVEDNKLNDEDEKNIEKTAYEMRRILNIQNIIPDNYFTVIQDSGINVLASAFNNNSFFGASSYSRELGSFIFVNMIDSIPEERQIFSLIHEMGHLLFNRNEYKESEYDPLYKSSRGDINEKMVDKFAGFFLLPRYLVKDYIESRDENINIIEMKHYFKVSIQALYMALKNYGFISKLQYREFWKKINLNGWKTKEPEPLILKSIEEKNTRLITSMKKLYTDEEVSVNRIAEVLDININEARKIVKGWGVLVDQYEKL